MVCATPPTTKCAAALILMPRFVRRFPFNVLLWDLDRWIKTGRPLV